MNAALEGFTRGWNALHTPLGWVIVEPFPVDQPERGSADGEMRRLHLPGELLERIVVLTAANPGGIETLDAPENAMRHARLVERIQTLEPFPSAVPVLYASIGGLPRGNGPADWDHREEGVALDISRDEAAMLAAEFGQVAYYAFDGPERLLIGAGDEGVLAVQRYRIHHS